MISIVVPAYNEEKIIHKLLDSLVKQKTEHKFEVIIVDNNSTDNTVDVVKSYQSKIPLTIVSEKIKGRSPARRAGFAQAKGEIILSTDADAIVPVHWIESLYEKFQNEKIVAVTGPCKISDCAPWRNNMYNVFQPMAMTFYRFMVGHYWLSGFNFAIRKNVYEESGGFDPFLNIQEDTDLSFRVVKLGKIQYVGNISVEVSGRRFKTGMVKGLLPYIQSYLNYLTKRKAPFLSDVR